MAEIIYPDGRKEIVGPAATGPAGPGETTLRAPSAFESYRSARQGATQKALGVLPLPGSAPETLAEFLTPQTRAEQGIEIGLAAMPGASKVMGPGARFAERTIGRALPATIGGSVGGALDRPGDVGHAAWEGLRGGVYSVLGNLPPEATALAKRGLAWLGRDKVVEAADAKAVGGAISQAVPFFGKLESKADLDKVGVRRFGLTALKDYREQMVSDINAALGTVRERFGSHPTLGGTRSGGVPIEVPALRGLEGESAMSFTKALDWLSKLSDSGWVRDQLARGLDASAARAIREQARTEIIGQLEARQPGLGQKFDRDMNMLARGHLFTNLLREANIFDDKGKLNMNALRDGLTKLADGVETYAQRLEKLLPAEEVKRFYTAIQRGAADLTARDTKGGLSARGHMSISGRPHVWIQPHMGSHVGRVPPVPTFPVTRGGTPMSFLAQGLTRESPDE